MTSEATSSAARVPAARRGRSIGAALQAWHAGLLAAVLIGFGLLAYTGMRRMAYAELDARLERAAQTIATSVHPGPGGPRGGGGPGGGPNGQGRPDGGDFREPPPEGGPGGNGDFRPGEGQPPFADTQPGRWRGPDNRGPDRGPGGGFGGFRGGPFHVDLPPEFAARFTGPEEGGQYFVIYRPDGSVFRTSLLGEVEAGLDPGQRYTDPATMPVDGGAAEPPVLRQRGAFREAYIYGPFGARVVVGQSAAPEQSSLHHLALLLGATGAAVMAIGLAGGWLLSRRVVKPLRAIAGVASAISASNLSRRMDLGEVPRELEDLARVMNDMFARLEGAFMQQTRFTADASHELRTPLSVIHTHAQLALSRERDPAEYKKTLATCLRASTRMKTLVDSLLVLAGADAGRLRIEKQATDLAAVAEDAAAMVAVMAAETGIAVATDIHPAPALADAGRMTQVAINLLTNAIRYNRPGGGVKISTGVAGGEAFMRVQDTGIGISAEHVAHIFERFFRADPSRTGEAGGGAGGGAGGHGLGLAICKSIVEAHGGHIAVRSEVGLGTTMEVRLAAEGAA